VDLLAIASAGHEAARLGVTSDAEALFQVNLFSVIIAAANFVIFLAIIWKFAFTPVAKILSDRKARIEQGLRDADQARRDRESAEAERLAALQDARREANEILARAQKVAQDSRDADIAATKADLEQMRQRASAEIDSEKQRAIAEIRSEVVDLALRAAGRVVGETMTDDRQRRLVSEFLAEAAPGAPGQDRNA
jgi:F-type H+-transporting ATPase subunit b